MRSSNHILPGSFISLCATVNKQRTHEKKICTMLEKKKKKDTETECNTRAEVINNWFPLPTDLFFIIASFPQH